PETELIWTSVHVLLVYSRQGHQTTRPFSCSCEMKAEKKMSSSDIKDNGKDVPGDVEMSGGAEQGPQARKGDEQTAHDGPGRADQHRQKHNFQYQRPASRVVGNAAAGGASSSSTNQQLSGAGAALPTSG
ncbi:unnamed protein product, partial [Amoebophrya sp. A25]